MISNERRITETTNYLKGFKESMDRDDVDFPPFVSVFDDRTEQALVLAMLPNMRPTDDVMEKAVVHMPALALGSLLKAKALGMTHDAWFVKANINDDNLEEMQKVRPSENIDRKQALVSLILDDTGKGFNHICEYGRDDAGKMYWADSTISPISVEGQEVYSWMIDLMTKSFGAVKGSQLGELEKEMTDDDFVGTIKSGLEMLSELNYQIALRPDFLEVVSELYPNADMSQLKELSRDLYEEE